MSSTWQDAVAEKSRRQQQSIPQEWLIKTPPSDVNHVIEIPESCGLLSAKDLEITGIVDVDVLLRKLASGEWSSVEVTTAFYKRAIIAQQLVRLSGMVPRLECRS
jgi:amidase